MSSKAAKHQLIVRNLEEEVIQELRLRAARHGRSAEAEHREILREVLVPRKQKSFKDLLLEIPQGGDGGDFERIQDYGRDVEAASTCPTPFRSSIASSPVLDSLLAATAKVHELILVTRNLKDVSRTGVGCLNPFTLKTT